MVKEYVCNRNLYKKIKKFDHKEMDEFLTKVYMEGWNNALKEVEHIGESPKEKLEKVLERTKGVGPKLKSAILNMWSEE